MNDGDEVSMSILHHKTKFPKCAIFLISEGRNWIFFMEEAVSVVLHNPSSDFAGLLLFFL